MPHHVASRLRRTRLLAAALLVAVSATACGEDSSGYDVADRVLEEIGPIAQPTGTEDCERTVTTDEYGFEMEVLDCPDGPAGESPAPLPDDLRSLLDAEEDLPAGTYDRLVDVVAGAVDTGTSATLGSLGDELGAMDEACGRDLDRWRARLAVVSGLVEQLAVDLEGDPPEGFVGRPAARGLARSVTERVVLQTGCRQPGGAAAVAEDQLAEDDVLTVTSDAAWAAIRLDAALTGTAQNPLFYLYTDTHYRWLRTQRQPVDLIVTGTSQAGDGIDLPVIADGLDVTAGNVFIPGGLAEVQELWLPEVERYIAPDTVIWLVGAIDLLTDCEQTYRYDDFVTRTDRLRRAYRAPGWLGSVDPVDAVLGPVGPPDPVRGDAPKQAEPDPEDRAAQLETYAGLGTAATFCAERAATIERVAEGLEADGQQVYVVGVPTSPELVELLGDGIESVTDAFERLAERLEVSGVIDLTGALQDDLDAWRDLTHMTASGAEEYSGLIVDELRSMGWGR